MSLVNQAEKVRETVFEAIEKFNKGLPQDRRLGKNLETTLLGGDENLDSVDFLNLIVLIEKNIAKEFKIPFTVFDINAMTKKNHPFRTVQTLIEYLVELLERRLSKDSQKVSNP